MKKPIILLLLLCCFSFVFKEELLLRVSLQNINTQTNSDTFRAHELNDKLLEEIRTVSAGERGSIIGNYFFEQQLSARFEHVELKDYIKKEVWEEYVHYCDAIWEDVEYFPVVTSTKNKEYTVTYADSWFARRTYGGERGHEGTDIMASVDTPGLYPVISMTDGVIQKKGWIEKGGWRVGITAPSGGYFYYAHLDSYADIEEGAKIEAGDIIGFMGDSGYGPEGTTGMFATHLHLGIYIYPDGEETSINPYWVLKMIEEKKLSCSF